MTSSVRRSLPVVLLGFLVALGLSHPSAPARSHPVAASLAAVYDVRSYGAKGDGSANDTPAIQKAVDAANAAGGGTVLVPAPGTYKSRNTIRMKSHVTFQVDKGATVQGSSGAAYDPPESNPNDKYQDYGHSHFHNAMIYGDRLTDIGFTGGGVIDGGGNLITGNPSSGQADKIISLTRCDGLRLGDGLTLRRGGHFAALVNGCKNVTSDHLTIDTASDRDGWNIISTTNVTVTHAHIEANDDALVFKSDYALGAKLPNGHGTVTDSYLSARCCNALMFGSETCGDFTDYRFERIRIEGADKSGLGMVSMDGAKISDVHYRDITMSDVHSPIMQKIGTRRRCGNNPGVGSIGDITYDHVTATGSSPSFSPTLWGESGPNHIRNVTFTHVDLTVPGGSGSVSTAVPGNDPGNYNPDSIGTRPAYGWYLHNADGVTFTDSSVRLATDDARPAVIANAGSSVLFDRFTAQRRGSSPYDMGFQKVTGYCVSASGNTSGGTLRLNSSGSTEDCGTPSGTRYEAESATYAAGSTVDSDHTGYSGSGFVNTPNASGSYVEWQVAAATAGTRTLTLAYSNGTTADRPVDIAVNGAVAAHVSLPPTANWDTWRTVAVTVPLTAGADTIRATATSAGGCPNLDYLDVPA